MAPFAQNEANLIDSQGSSPTSWLFVTNQLKTRHHEALECLELLYDDADG